MQGRLNVYLIDKNTLRDEKHGFRAKKGITTAIAVTGETIVKAVADKQIYAVLRDVTKTFDKTWH